MFEAIQKVVAIDGPSGCGKSTVAMKVAEKMKFLYIDTGAMYRAIGLAFHERNILLNNQTEIQKALGDIDFQYGISPDQLVVIDSKNMTDQIRQHWVSQLASDVSKIPLVREYLVEFQRTLVFEGFCVMEGRDIGSVVFPNAFCKIFLTASDQIRAQRRMKQLKKKGEDVLFEKVLEDIQKRDHQDQNRSHSPLQMCDDSIELNTDHLDREQVQYKIIELIHQRANELGLEF